MPVYRSRQQWNERRDHLRKQILSAAGLLPMPAKTPLRPSFPKKSEFGSYSIDSVLLESMPGYYLGGNLYRPLNLKGAAPAVLVPHGHWKGGRLESQPSYSVPALAINLAMQGYVVFAYDMAGYNDTRQTPHDFGGWAEDLWGFHPMGLQLWNSIRALDFLESLHYVDVKRLAVTGASGGATQGFLLTAVDDRVRFAAPVNMISAHMQGGDPCEEAPGLRDGTSNVEFAALAAPRPMLIVSSTHDWTRNTPVEEYPAIQRIYGLYGATSNVENAHIDAAHNYNRQSREAVYRFLAKHMHPERPDFEDVDVEPPPDSDMLAFGKADTPAGLAGFDEVFEHWKASALIQAASVTDAGAVRESLRYTLGVEWPAQIRTKVDGNGIVLGRAGMGDRITGIWMPGRGSAVLVVHPDGATAALHMKVVEEARRTGRPVLAIDRFQSSDYRTRKEPYEYFLSYNKTDAALQVQDVLTALAFLKEQCRGTPELIGLGDAGITSLFAAAVAPVPIDVLADLNGFGGSDRDFRDRFFVPGIQRVGGLSTALRLTNQFRAAIPARASRQQQEQGVQ